MTWLWFALMTVACWGVYGVLLHIGQVNMADPAQGRYKAFLLVGIAYFVTAVVAPLVLLVWNGASWQFWTYPTKGIVWSFIAGIMGAAGAFGVLLAFGAKGSPAAVMSIVFAGAPVINALVSLAMHPPKSVPPLFIVGILLAATGGFLVTKFKPVPATPAKPGPAAAMPTDPGPPTAGR